VSSTEIRDNGNSPRATFQVNKFNARNEAAGGVANRYYQDIKETDIPGRSLALESEQNATDALYKAGNSMSEHELPRPSWEKKK
jgi:hypothetical protein